MKRGEGQSNHPRSTDGGHRFLAFAFAASEMVVEADPDGTITYAAGAFRSRLGMEPEAALGRHLSELTCPADWDAVDAALMLLRERGRLLPCIVRLANPAHSTAVLAGLRLLPNQEGSPICLTIGIPPASPGPARNASPSRLIQAAQSCLGNGDPGHVALLELAGGAGVATTLSTVLGEVSPRTMASEVAPGRFGLLIGDDVDDLLSELERALERHDGTKLLCSRHLPLDTQGLTRSQAALAVRQALTVFAREGVTGVDRAGSGAGLAAHVREALSQVTGLRRAIAQRNFAVLYQPIVDLATRQVHHYEALLRPAQSLAPYGTQQFVCTVETAGLAAELDFAVFSMVCEAAERSTASIAVNMSGQSIQDPAFRDRLMPLLGGSSAAKAGRLFVELTETVPVDSLPEAAETVRCLHGLGIQFCIDDFGAGAADIRLLRALPTDVVKLDGSFVAGFMSGGSDHAFVTGTVQIAKAAGAVVVAERIETEAEAVAMMSVGVSLGQGWLFGHAAPLPVELPPGPPAATRPAASARTARDGKRLVELDQQWG